MIAKAIIYHGVKKILICDGCCDKAWGIQIRPRVKLSSDEDDYAHLADQELGIAPVDPGTYEGMNGKPKILYLRLNKWCARECERSIIADPIHDFELPNYTKRIRNID